MAEGTKRPRATEPPRQGGGFVTGGDDAWTQQDPDTWAKMGTPNATPLRPADEKRREEGGNGTPARPPRTVIAGPPSRPPAPSPEVARMFTRAKGNEDDPSTVVGVTKTTPNAPKPGVARIDGARMEIVNFDGVGSRVPGGPASLHDDGGAHPPPSRLDQLFPGHPPIRIVRRPRKEAAAGRVLLSVGVIVALGAFAWHRYDKFLESNVPSPNKVIYTKIEDADDAGATEGEGSGSGPPAAAPVGTLTVTSNRSATVYVDGRAMGSVPLDKVRIVKGTHEIKVVDEKTLESRTRKIKISAGQHEDEPVNF